MGKKVRSARGEIVDFDLLKVKEQIASRPAIDVSEREAFIERRLRRRPKRSTTPIPASKVVAEEPVEEPTVDDFEQEAEQLAEETVPTRTARKVK